MEQRRSCAEEDRVCSRLLRGYQGLRARDLPSSK
jgi:hypothetical protein